MGIVDAWNASVRTRGTAADCGRRVRWSMRRVGDSAPYLFTLAVFYSLFDQGSKRDCQTFLRNLLHF